MDFQRLLDIVGKQPLFDSSILLSGDVNPASIRLQLTRWVKANRIIQLRRGLYTLAPPYQKVQPHPFTIANQIQGASYVSCQSALAYYGLIPELVPGTISMTTKRPGSWQTPLGVFEYRHIQPKLLAGYAQVRLDDEQQAFVATPEKALFDLLYLQPGSDLIQYLSELRLQNMERIDLSSLQSLVDSIRSPKLERALPIVIELAHDEAQEYEFA